jgi:hypothetical protein
MTSKVLLQVRRITAYAKFGQTSQKRLEIMIILRDPNGEVFSQN